MKRKYNLVIGQKTAQSMKETLGSGIPGNTQTMVVVGRDVVSGLPIEMEMSGAVVYEAIKDNLNTICNSIKMILEKNLQKILSIPESISQAEVPRFMIWISCSVILQESRSIPARSRRSVWCADS